MNGPFIHRITGFNLRITLFGLMLILGHSALAEPNAEFKGVLRTETANGPSIETPFWAGTDQLRMDITQPMEMTVVWSFGAEKSMLMIRHDEKIYVEWGALQLKNARQMVQQANRGKRSAKKEPLQFEATDALATIEGWSAFEMRLLPAEAGSRLWMSNEADNGLIEFFSHYARALHETTQFPMVGTENDPLGLYGGMRLPLDRLGTATGLEGRVVRIVEVGTGSVPGHSTTITMHSVEPGPFPDDLFAVPDGYIEKAQLSSGVQ